VLPTPFEKNHLHPPYSFFHPSFPTGTSWIPTDINLPITVSNMSRTRWGKNWGQYDRMEWVQDVDINEVCCSCIIYFKEVPLTLSARFLKKSSSRKFLVSFCSE
jgi:hypothetical protein